MDYSHVEVAVKMQANLGQRQDLLELLPPFFFFQSILLLPFLHSSLTLFLLSLHWIEFNLLVTRAVQIIDFVVHWLHGTKITLKRG